MFSTLRELARLMHGARLHYSLAIVSLVVASSFLYLAPLVPQAVLDVVLAHEGAEPSEISGDLIQWMGGPVFLAQRLWVPALLVVALTCVAGAFTYLRERLAEVATERIVLQLRDRLHDRLQRLPTPFHDDAESGDLVQRCTSDVDTVRMFLGGQVVEFGRAVVMLFVPLPLMLAVDTRMTLASVVLVPAIIGFSLFFFGKVHRAYLRSDESEASLTANVQENISGIRVVRAFARQAFERSRFGRNNDDYRDADYRVYAVAGWFWGISDFLCFAQQAVVLVTGIVFLAQGTLTVGALFFFITAVSMFTFPMRQLGRIVSDFGKATVSLGRIRVILDTAPEQESANPESFREASGVSFDDVTFAYGDAEPTLHNVSFEVPAGGTLAIVGPPGSGKSTIVALLLRMYEASAGTISVGGVDITSVTRGDLRRRVGVVHQEAFLFSKPLIENLKMGRPEATMAEVHDATRAACVHEAIEKFEKGYATKVGERGVTLSGGQRQRVAIARTLLEQPRVLVLDDALSAVDTRTEASILRGLRERHQDTTTIVIAHRLSTLAIADWVVVLDGGRVVQQGPPDQLGQVAGPYARIVASQHGWSDAAGEEMGS